MSSAFPAYEAFAPLVPVFRATDAHRPSLHRFYDTSPISPSGRYLAVTELPFDDRLPRPDDVAHVVVIDLRHGQRVFEAATTAWDTQVGAHAQWGTDDHSLLFNVRRDVDAPPVAAVADPVGGGIRHLAGAVYMASPDGATLLAPDLEKLALVQAGYGVRVPRPDSRRHQGFPEDDGLFATDVATGSRRLVLSHAALARHLPDAFAGLDPTRGGLYGFHVKWHPRGDRVLFMVRWLPSGRTGGTTRNVLVACDPDGAHARPVLGWRRWGGGHHPNWWPVAHDVVMNLGFDRTPRAVLRAARFGARLARRAGWRVPTPGRLAFARIPGDGGPPSAIHPHLEGSGHPSIDATERLLVTDAYPDERVAYGDGTVPLRCIDLASGHERTLVRIRTRAAFEGPNAQWRVDPHPAWSPDGRRLAFNGCPDGVRGVFVADLGALLDAMDAGGRE